jgi:hypothetical protein
MRRELFALHATEPKSSVNKAGRSPIALAKLNHHYDAVLELLD